MATTEGAAASLGPRYAPDDPTLPQPWKGLIDGSTGMLYYWNPETNVTQYEKPAALPPPLPSGPPPEASVPKLASIPGASTVQQNDAQGQQSQQTFTQQGQQSQQTYTPQGQQSQQPFTQHSQHTQQPFTQQSQQPFSQQGQQSQQAFTQQGQQMTHMPQHSQVTQQVPHGSQGFSIGQQQGSPVGPAMQQGPFMPQLRPQMMQQPGHQMPSQMGQSPNQPGPHVSQPAMQQMMPPQLGPHGQAFPGVQMGQQHGYQFSHHQTQHNAYPQNLPPQGQQMPQQQNQSQQFSHQQEHKLGGFQQREDVDFSQGKQVGFSPQQTQQSGASPAQNLPGGTGSVSRPQMSAKPDQALQFGGSPFNIPQSSSLGQWQQNASDSGHRPPPRFPGQMGSGMAHGQELDTPPAGSKKYEENSLGREGNEYYYNSNMDGRIRPPLQHPKLAAIPGARNQHEMRMSDPPLQNPASALPGGFNGTGGPPMQNIYGQAAGGPAFPNPNIMRPPSALTGPPGAIHPSPVEAYLQKHEVTATGGDVPAPFMTFEDTGFPPEILREVRYLLRRRSTCRTL